MNLLTAGNETRVHFELSADPGSEVFVAGSFNNWDPTATPLADSSENGRYRASVTIPSGTHEYKFVVNGIYSMDPTCPDWALNSFGSLNSVLRA